MALIIDREYHRIAGATIVFKGPKAKIILRVEVSPNPSAAPARDYEVVMAKRKLVDMALPDAEKYVKQNCDTEIKVKVDGEIKDMKSVLPKGEDLNLTSTQKQTIKRRVAARLASSKAGEMGSEMFETIMRHAGRQGIQGVCYEYLKMLNPKAKEA